MTDDVLDRVRAVDPLPPGSSAPPFESVFARLTDMPQRRRRDGRRRVLSLLGPAVGVAVTASLITAAVLLLHPAHTVSHHLAATDQRRTSHPTIASHRSVSGRAGGLSRVAMARFAQLEHATPRELFIANPVHMFPHAPHQTVIPHTVRRAATFTVPGAGRFEFWIARSRKGWLCRAVRQPDGTWADLGTRGNQISGPVPGCGVPWQDKQGFSYLATLISTRQGGFRIVYGYAPAAGHPVTIRDRLSEATAAIGDGRYFAIIIPLCQRAGCMRRLTFPTHYFQLETLNATGQVLIRNEVDHGN